MGQDKKETTAVKTSGRLADFFRETWAEMKKVSWPDPPKVIRSTIVVLVIVVAVGLFIAVMDYFFTQVLHLSLDLAKSYK